MVAVIGSLSMGVLSGLLFWATVSLGRSRSLLD
jgi:hypothetical protein